MTTPPTTGGFSAWGRRRAESIGTLESSLEGTNRPQSSSSSRPAGSILSNPLQQLGDSRLSSSLASGSHREPIRSFINPAQRDNLAPVSTAQYARSVREDTAELATYQLADKADRRRASFLSRNRSHSFRTARSSDLDADDTTAAPIVETSELGPSQGGAEEDDVDVDVDVDVGVDAYVDSDVDEGPSLLTRALRRSPPQHHSTLTHQPRPEDTRDSDSTAVFSDGEDGAEAGEGVPPVRITDILPPASKAGDASADSHPPLSRPTETTPLLGDTARRSGYDLESQKESVSRRMLRFVGWHCKQSAGHADSISNRMSRAYRSAYRSATTPEVWNRKALFENVVVAPVACLPAVIVGLLLNILDALSYGMILFPLGSPIFSHLGSAGISIFYVSTIVSQLVMSCGSIFKGGVGSELIEVVPFFHSMAQTITGIVGEDNPDAVIATTITSYALSSMLTGAVFYLMGQFRFGYLVGFIPRHILIGCIGGVGWFLVATGFEVTARIDGNLSYDLDTLRKLIQPDTVPLWIAPFALAIVLFWGQKYITSKYFLPLYIISIPFCFYFFTLVTGTLNQDSLQNHGWVFEGPPADEPWWYFYTLYQLSKVHWGAIFECIPAMLALTFFGIINVPINVPALALNTGEDHCDLDHELKLHGVSNVVSGAMGSIQNYLVYANTLFFIRSGGDSRLAGFELAFLTFCVMLVGPKLIGFIPIMMVGCLIFDLGFELLVEAVWEPRKKLKPAEYATVIAIVLIMGIYDFVVGIGVGILLAFVSLIFQTSQVSAVRATYDGEIVSSTVRRNTAQHNYLRKVGRQVRIMKLAGYLFFGTIVSVERKIRDLIADDTFRKHPIRYLVLDLRQVTGLDYSAGEAFNTISRLLDGKGIHLVLSGIDTESALGHDLRAVGVGEDGIEVVFLPDINTALEYCENDLLKTLYASQEAHDRNVSKTGVTTAASTATATATTSASPSHRQLLANPDASTPSADLLASSPRRSHLQEAARESLNNMELRRHSKWQNFSEPLRLMMAVFHDVSDKNEDFWFRASSYFVRREFKAGQTLFTAGAVAKGFYLVEKGIVRAEYDLAHGQCYHESIVAGTTCGELPFFSETARTATVHADMDCTTWVLEPDAWTRLQKDHPDVANELLRISLKLTAERMSTVPSSTMLMAD